MRSFRKAQRQFFVGTLLRCVTLHTITLPVDTNTIHPKLHCKPCTRTWWWIIPRIPRERYVSRIHSITRYGLNSTRLILQDFARGEVTKDLNDPEVGSFRRRIVKLRALTLAETCPSWKIAKPRRWCERSDEVLPLGSLLEDTTWRTAKFNTGKVIEHQITRRYATPSCPAPPGTFYYYCHVTMSRKIRDGEIINIDGKKAPNAENYWEN